jgi:hypothetical protein
MQRGKKGKEWRNKRVQHTCRHTPYVLTAHIQTHTIRTDSTNADTHHTYRQHTCRHTPYVQTAFMQTHTIRTDRTHTDEHHMYTPHTHVQIHSTRTHTTDVRTHTHGTYHASNRLCSRGREAMWSQCAQ